MALIKSETRICFGLEWYDSESEAEARAKEVKAQGRTYNGGFLDGKRCGREPSFDTTDGQGRKLYQTAPQCSAYSCEAA